MFMHLLVQGHVDDFQVKVNMDRANINIRVQICFCKFKSLFLLGKHLGEGLLVPSVNAYLTSKETVVHLQNSRVKNSKFHSSGKATKPLKKPMRINFFFGNSGK